MKMNKRNGNSNNENDISNRNGVINESHHEEMKRKYSEEEENR